MRLMSNIRFLFNGLMKSGNEKTSIDVEWGGNSERKGNGNSVIYKALNNNFFTEFKHRKKDTISIRKNKKEKKME